MPCEKADPYKHHVFVRASSDDTNCTRCLIGMQHTTAAYVCEQGCGHGLCGGCYIYMLNYTPQY